MFTNFGLKHANQFGDMPVFLKGEQFYTDQLTFNFDQVIEGLEFEVAELNKRRQHMDQVTGVQMDGLLQSFIA